MLKVNHVQKHFGKKQVLKDINLELEPGQRIHIIGKNGSGKSTIFKVVTGILKPDQGDYAIDATDYLGALIENPGFLEYETGFENLKFLAQLNNNFEEAKIKQLMERFELDPDDPQAVKSYSIGMRQKLGIIQAVMEDQNIILFDEPTRGIDKTAVQTFVKLLDELKNEHKAVIIASHEDVEGLTYDQEYKLNDGVLASV